MQGYWHRCSTPTLPMPICHVRTRPTGTAQTARSPAGGTTAVAQAQHQRGRWRNTQRAERQQLPAPAMQSPSHTHHRHQGKRLPRSSWEEVRKHTSRQACRSSSRACTTPGRSPAVKQWQLLLRQLAAPLVTHSPLPVTQASVVNLPPLPRTKLPCQALRPQSACMHSASTVPAFQALRQPSLPHLHPHTCWTLAQGPDSNPTPSMPIISRLVREAAMRTLRCSPTVHRAASPAANHSTKAQPAQQHDPHSHPAASTAAGEASGCDGSITPMRHDAAAARCHLSSSAASAQR